MKITEDYIILGGIEFIRMHASNVARLLDLIVGNVNNRGLLSTLPVIDTLVQVSLSNSRCSALLQKILCFLNCLFLFN